MNSTKYIFRSLRYYWKRHALLAFGIAIGVAVLSGAFIVGDSVDYSLKMIAEKRLGKTEMVMQSGERFFTEELSHMMAEELQIYVSPMLKTEGSIVVDGGQLRMNKIAIYGIDSSFFRFTPNFPNHPLLNPPLPNQASVSANLASQLNLSVGDEILLKMTRKSLIPLNAPFVSDADNILNTRLTVSSILSEEELGMFNLQNSQQSAKNVFLNLQFLQELMDLDQRSNLMLLSEDVNEKDAYNALSKNWVTRDAGFTLRLISEKKKIEFLSDRVFIDKPFIKGLEKSGLEANNFITYFVNSISTSTLETPYSFVSTVNSEVISEDEIIINDWLSEDLDVTVGDTLELKYFLVGPLRELSVDSVSLVVSKVVPVDSDLLDSQLMPEIPGMSNAGNCRDWDTGTPVDLTSIRDKDEGYWTRYKGTPKALISVDLAERLWSNRFGVYTSFRFSSELYSEEEVAAKILQSINPQSLGFIFRSVKSDARFAASNGVDFAQLFGGLSFFLIAAALLLSVLFLLLNLFERREQMDTLQAIGIPKGLVRKMLMTESFAVALLGSLLGLFLSVLYTKIVFAALNGVWMDIVRTNMLVIHIRFITLFQAFIISLGLTFLLLLLYLNKYLKSFGEERENKNKKVRRLNVLMLISGILLLVSMLIVVIQLLSAEVQNASAFFLSGSMLLLSGLGFMFVRINRFSSEETVGLSLSALGRINMKFSSSRSFLVIALFASASFLVISTGSNRKDLLVNVKEKSSGSGAYDFYAESSAPVLLNLNASENRFEYGIEGDYDFVQIYKAEGDDASCLNLNRISNPAILGVNPEDLTERFSFVSRFKDHFDEEDPWNSLNKELPNGVIPAIADETVIKWGLGMKVGDTLLYKNAEGEEYRLLLVGGLSPSIFQGSILISKEKFLKQYPTTSGSNVFLVSADSDDSEEPVEELKAALRDYGWEMQHSGERLIAFYSVTNTYLSIFLILGALALLLGTVGLSIVLYRSVLERKAEFALLRSLGYTAGLIRKLIFREYLLLLVSGLLIGTLSAFAATLPSYVGQTDISLSFILLLLIAILLNGVLWIWLVSGVAIRNQNLLDSLHED